MGFTTTEAEESETTGPVTESTAGTLSEPTPDELHNFLANNTDLTEDSLNDAVAEIQDEIPFLSTVAAYYLLGNRHGIDVADVFETAQRDYSLDVANLQPEMNTVDLTATIDQLTDVNTFTRDDGTTGKVCNLILADGTGRTTIPLWDDDTQLADQLSTGDTVRVENGYSKSASDFCQSRFGCTVEVRIGDGQLLQKDGDEWSELPA